LREFVDLGIQDLLNKEIWAKAGRYWHQNSGNCFDNTS
jgi:hypothetical protein